MNSNTILSSDLLDILFEKRNKMYGAYDLRKFYPSRVKASLCIMLGMAVIFSAFTFLPGGKTSPIDQPFEEILMTKTIDIPKEPEKIQPQAPPQKIVSQQKFTPNIVAVKDDEPTTALHDINKLAIGSTTFISDLPPGAGDVLPGNASGTGDVAPPAPAAAPAVSQEPVDDPDIQASFPGGSKELIRFLEKNLHAPEDISEGVAVKIKFVVGFDGALESFDIIQDGGVAFNEEVIRVLKKMPRWNPGKKGGRNVRVFYYLPVKFQPTE
jgi:periplasmic protein TonB